MLNYGYVLPVSIKYVQYLYKTKKSLILSNLIIESY